MAELKDQLIDVVHRLDSINMGLRSLGKLFYEDEEKRGDGAIIFALAEKNEKIIADLDELHCSIKIKNG